MNTAGTLYLVPVGLGSGDVISVLSPALLRRLAELRYFIVENPKTARRFLKDAGYPHPMSSAEFQVLDEHTAPADIPQLLAPLLAGMDGGLLSEAGCPAVADPGSALVRLAHDNGIRVTPLIGPSAVLLALMASGMNGQRFAFHGYLPIRHEEKILKIQSVMNISRRQDATQIFIEAPYRNQALLMTLLEVCQPTTLLCLATDITLESERIITRTVAQWKKSPPDIQRRPTVFLLYSREEQQGR